MACIGVTSTKLPNACTSTWPVGPEHCRTVEEYGYGLSIEEMDAVREQLERAKKRAERVADAFDYEDER